MYKCSNGGCSKTLRERITGEQWRTMTYEVKTIVTVEFCCTNCIEVWEHRQETQGKKIRLINEERN